MKTAVVYIFLCSSFCFLHAGNGKKPKQEDTTRIQVTRLKINSSRADFGPVVINNTLYFSSAREHRMGARIINENKGDVVDIFYCSLRDSVNGGKVKPFSGSFNSRLNDCPGSFTKKADKFYLSRNLKTSTGLQPLKIYSSSKQRSKWTKPELVPFCRGSNNFCHPVLMQDQQTMIFASDIPGGFGGMDIYFSKFENGEWSKPVNFGEKVNSKHNEIFPFVSENNLLYFASDRPGGFGGLDIYQLDLSDPVDNKILLLEYPLNSSYDDFGVWVDSTGESGYFSSNRNSKSSDDIYYFKVAYPDFKNVPAPKVKDKFCYTFYEEASAADMDTTGMTYEWNFGDGQKSRGLKAKHCYSKPGIYKVQLNVVEKSSGEIFTNQLSYDHVIDPPACLGFNCSDTLRAGSEISFNAGKSDMKGYKIKQVYWSFGDGRLNSGYEVKHVFRKEGEYTVELGVVAINEATGKNEKFRVVKKINVSDSF